jgi:hypothetical protein
VIASGPYSFVRHPGYTAAIALFVAIPIALASWWALLPAAVAIALLIVRTSWEDRLLQGELSGYADYARRTRYRLLPGFCYPAVMDGNASRWRRAELREQPCNDLRDALPRAKLGRRG